MAWGDWIGLIFALPLAGRWVAQGLGWYVFYLSDPGYQWFWGTMVQLFAGLPFYVRTLRDKRRNVVVAIPSLGIYLYSLAAYRLLAAGGRSLPLLFDLAAAVLLVGVCLSRMLERPRRSTGDLQGKV